MDPQVSLASVIPVATSSGLPSHHSLSNDLHFQIQRRVQEHQQQQLQQAQPPQQQQIVKYEIWPAAQTQDGVPPGWNGPVFHGMAPPTVQHAGNMMHFSGYASFLPPSGFPPPNIAIALKADASREDPRIEYMRSVSQLSSESDTTGVNTQDDSEEEGDKIQSKKGRGKGKKSKKEGKKMKGEKSPPEKRYKCPECSLMFPHVSALYNHASLRHYRQQLSEKYRKRFGENSQRCHLCNLPQTWSTFLQHIGSRHRRIHYFMSPDIHKAYMELPTRHGHTKVTGRIGCLVCTTKDFSSLTQYKQHLTTHFWKKMTDKFGNCNGKVCPQCSKHFGHSSGVLMHLGAKHNYIMEFAPQNVIDQLNQLGVN